MTDQESEEADNLRKRKSAEFLAHCREQEAQARLELTRCIEQTKRAKEKDEALFVECEKRAVERRRYGQIINRID